MATSQRVLVVDDEPSHRTLVGAILKKVSLSYDEAEDGAAAIGALRRREYGAVILDLVMPGIDGFGVVNTLRAANPALLSRVIVLASADADVVSRVDRGVFRVMAKPFAAKELAITVRNCLLQDHPADSTLGAVG